MEIRELNRDELTLITSLAHEIWPITFAEILSTEQIAYMLDWMYNEKQLSSQHGSGHSFFALYLNNEAIGFMGIEPNYLGTTSLKIHKLYVKPNVHGKGLGKEFIEFAKLFALRQNCSSLVLNVNRFNKAVQFYLHVGFTITKEEDIEIGNGFLMEDYVMELKL